MPAFYGLENRVLSRPSARTSDERYLRHQETALRHGAEPDYHTKPMGQKLHRMAITAWHDAAAFQLLMFRQSGEDSERYEASHLCGNARCFRPDHLVVEGHGVNEGRKHCVAG